MRTQPYHRVNVFTGVSGPKVIAKDEEDAARFAGFVKKAERPLLVLGAKADRYCGLDRPLVEYALDMVISDNIPICATAHSQKALVEKGFFPESNYDLMEILNHLKNKDWKGVKGEGNHDLVIFIGFRTDLLEQGLSALRNFAPHLKTMVLDNYIHAHADYTLPNFIKVEKWSQFLKSFIQVLQNSDKEGG